MMFRRRSSARPRPTWPAELERTEPLRGQPGTRSERAMRAASAEPDVHPGWRALATVVALVEAGLLAWLWFGPVMAVRAVEVVGARHLTSSQVAHAAGLQGSAMRSEERRVGNG